MSAVSLAFPGMEGGADVQEAGQIVQSDAAGQNEDHAVKDEKSQPGSYTVKNMYITQRFLKGHPIRTILTYDAQQLVLGIMNGAIAGIEPKWRELSNTRNRVTKDVLATKNGGKRKVTRLVQPTLTPENSRTVMKRAFAKYTKALKALESVPLYE